MDWQNFRAEPRPQVGPNSLAITGQYSTGQGTARRRFADRLEGPPGEGLDHSDHHHARQRQSADAFLQRDRCLAVGFHRSQFPCRMFTGQGSLRYSSGPTSTSTRPLSPRRSAGSWGNAGYGIIPGPQSAASTPTPPGFPVWRTAQPSSEIQATNALNHPTITGLGHARCGSGTIRRKPPASAACARCRPVCGSDSETFECVGLRLRVTP